MTIHPPGAGRSNAASVVGSLATARTSNWAACARLTSTRCTSSLAAATIGFTGATWGQGARFPRPLPAATLANDDGDIKRCASPIDLYANRRIQRDAAHRKFEAQTVLDRLIRDRKNQVAKKKAGGRCRGIALDAYDDGGLWVGSGELLLEPFIQPDGL